MTNLRNLSFCTFLFLCYIAIAQTDVVRFPVVELHSSAGQLLPHRSSVRDMQNGELYQSYELRVGLQTQGDQAWHHDLNFPIYGFGAYWADFNNPIVGTPMALYSYIDVPIYQKGDLTLSSNWALGLSFNFNEYNKDDVQPNIAIGTDKNAFIAFALAGEYRINPFFGLSLGAKMCHYSNGCVRRPNLGLNVASGALTLRYYIAGDEFEYVEHVELDPVRKLYYTLMYAGGLADINDNTDIQYYCSTTTASAHYVINRKRTVGLGCDVFYRAYLKDDVQNINAYRLSQQMSYGLHLSSQYVVNRVHAYVQLGLYVWRPYAYDVPFYERIGIRYFFLKEHCFANVSVFAHDIRALYTEWGIGVRF